MFTFGKEQKFCVNQICTSLIYYSLYQKIDFANFECLNESEEDSGKRVFRPWETRLDKNSSDCVISDCDAELLFNIPFTGNVKLKVCSKISLEIIKFD